MGVNKKSDLIRVFVKGGFLSPANLLKILDISGSLGNNYVLFGSRQDILFPAGSAVSSQIDQSFRSININYELGSDQSIHQNIVSSYAAVNLVETTHWVKEDTYNVITDNFDYVPKLKINVVDPRQSLVPLFTGELNYVASNEDNYWYLYIRDARKKNSIELWPRLVSGQDIPKLSKKLEELFVSYNPFATEELYMIVKNESMRISYKPISQNLKLPENSFPYYEGFNGMTNNQYWLGLYWRNNKYDLDFLSAACKLCQETNISNINIIPWKAFIIKGIKAADRIRWEKLMGKYGINERHSSLELNWHLPVLDEEALELKRFLVKDLDQQDISTKGLTFAIKTGREYFPFTTILIESEPDQITSQFNLYTISYAKDFNSNNTNYYPYARHVQREMIPALLIELSKLYFRQLNPEKEQALETPSSQGETSLAVTSFQCSNCLTVYDLKYGDPESGINPGTPFEELPETYSCRVCDSPKKFFKPMHNK
ncbi:MAG: rubredoxin [Bacteroidetes bacterium]|nr:rubredoxin [Bacteroidota bacterium]